MEWREIAPGVAVMQYPLRAFGIDFRRCVTLLRLADGRVVIHSSAPFTAEDVAAIRRFGVPSWLVEATLMHDTFARRVRAVFPDIPYLAPDGFAKLSGVPTRRCTRRHPTGPARLKCSRSKVCGKSTNTHFFIVHRARSCWPTCFSISPRIRVAGPGSLPGTSCVCRGCLGLAPSFG